MASNSGFWDDIVPRADPERCRLCADCPPVAACSAQSFRRDGPGSLPFADENFCFGCYSCANACPYKAIVLPRHR
jgi:Fe-S-cluster-containing dehydrogenase component